MRVHVKDLTDSVASTKSLKDPKVKALVEVDNSGMVIVREITATFDLGNTSSITESVLSFFGKKDEKPDSEESLVANVQPLIFINARIQRHLRSQLLMQSPNLRLYR